MFFITMPIGWQWNLITRQIGSRLVIVTKITIQLKTNRIGQPSNSPIAARTPSRINLAGMKNNPHPVSATKVTEINLTIERKATVHVDLFF